MVGSAPSSRGSGQHCMIQRPIVYIAGLGVAIPERVVTNADFEKTLDTSDQWIVERTGIERRFARPDETVSTMGRDAAVKRFSEPGPRHPSWTASSSRPRPRTSLPSTACQIQALLGASAPPLRHRRGLFRVRLRSDHRGGTDSHRPGDGSW